MSFIGQSSITRLSQNVTYTNSAVELAKEILRDVFLPHGYPESVSEDYFNYQIWDTVQAFCSTITGTFTTRAILQGVGVGNAEATPLAAAITWITKDGTGMLGRILFAWWKGYVLYSSPLFKNLFLSYDLKNDNNIKNVR